MFKSTFLAFMALFFCLSAQAGSYIRTHEDFVHLSEYEKNQMIIKTMELVVALESQYDHEVKKYGYNSERFEKFMKAVSKVKSILFIDSAYAAGSPGKIPMTNWNSYGNAFKKLMNKPLGSLCFFAGWPSKTYLEGANTYCAHPDFLQGEGPNRHTEKPMAEWTQYYPDPKGNDCGKNDQKKIQCNPAIFGFQNALEGSLFCVTASDGAHNSAFNCMQEALKDRPAGGQVDPPAKRLSDLRTALDGNSEAFKAIQEFVYKTCVCESAPKNFNRNYQAYVRKHRTCFGMMEMLAAVTCGAQTPMMDTSIFTSLRNYTKDKKIVYNGNDETNTSEANIDYHYDQFIKNEVQVSAKDEYNLICKGIAKPEVVVEPTKEYDCTKATCQKAVAAGVTSYACSTFTIKVKGTDEVATMDANPTEKPTEDNQQALPITGSIGGIAVTLSCPLEIKQPDAVAMSYKCSKANCNTIAPAAAGGKATFECSYTVHEKDKPDAVASFEVDTGTGKPAEGAVQTEGAKLSITGKVGTQTGISLECPLTIVPLATAVVETKKLYTCTKAECTATAAASRPSNAYAGSTEVATTSSGFTCSLEATEKDKTDKIPSLSGSPDAAPKNGDTSVFKVSIAGKEESLSCPVSIKVAEVTPKIEPKPAAQTQLGGPAPMNPGPPRPQMRGSSDTSAVGIK